MKKVSFMRVSPIRFYWYLGIDHLPYSYQFSYSESVSLNAGDLHYIEILHSNP